MKRIAVASALMMLLSAVASQAQTPAPKPGPEHKKLEVFLGTWSREGEVKPGNAYGIPAGNASYVERYEWLPGQFFLQMNREGKGPAGEVKHMFIYGYDAVAKKYTSTWYELVGGGSFNATLTNTGNTWLWSGSGNRNGKLYQERCTTTFVSSTSYTLKCETSFDGKTWSLATEAKGTRIKL